MALRVLARLSLRVGNERVEARLTDRGWEAPGRSDVSCWLNLNYRLEDVGPSEGAPVAALVEKVRLHEPDVLVDQSSIVIEPFNPDVLY